MPYILPAAPATGASFSTASDRYVWNGTRWNLQSTVNSANQPGDWVTVSGITIGGTTTAPTKPATRVQDYVRYRKTGFKNYELEYKYAQTSIGSGGSGDHVFSLPTGVSFNTTVHPIYNGALGSGVASYSLPNAACRVIAYGANDADALVVPFSATQFRLWVYIDLSNTRTLVGSVNYGINTIATMAYDIRLNITAA